MDAQGNLPLPDLPGIESGWELLTVSERRVAGRCSAASLEHDQARLELMVSALAEGRPVRTVAKAFNTSTNLVLAVKRKYGPEIETEKQRLGVECMDVARLAMERMREEIDLMPRASLPIVVGVMVDKGSLLTGAPTARVRVETVDAVASVADYIASLPAAVPVKTGEKVGEKEAGVGGRGEVVAIEGTSRDGSAGEDGVRGGGDGEALDALSSDEQSLVSGGLKEVKKESKADNGRNEAQKGGVSP